LGYVGVKKRNVWSGRQDSKLRALDSKSSPYIHLRNAQKIVKFWLRGKDLNLYFLIQSQASCRLDDPEMIWDFGLRIWDLISIGNLKSQIQNRNGFGAIRTRNFRFRRPVFLIPLNYEAGRKLEGTRGFEPPTCSSVASRANSIAPRPQLDFRVPILDYLFIHHRTNPKSKI
jgi:hypothetical protein